MRKLWFAALCAAGVLLAGQANAATFIATYSGTITSNPANSGFEGFLGSADLTGVSVRAIFTYDVGLGTHTISAASDVLSGGESFGPGVASPIIQADLKFLNTDGSNRLTISTNPMWDSVAEIDFSPGSVSHTGIRCDACGTGGEPTQTLIASFQTPTPPATQGSPVDESGSGSGSFTFGRDGMVVNLAGTFDVTSFSIVEMVEGGPGGVPEPTSWALMISGFGLAGAALRHRRATA